MFPIMHQVSMPVVFLSAAGARAGPGASPRRRAPQQALSKQTSVGLLLSRGQGLIVMLLCFSD